MGLRLGNGILIYFLFVSFLEHMHLMSTQIVLLLNYHIKNGKAHLHDGTVTMALAWNLFFRAVGSFCFH